MAKAGTITVAGTNTSNQAFTGIGFQPALVLFWCLGDVPYLGNGYHQRSFGAYNGSQQVVMGGWISDGRAYRGDSGPVSTACIRVISDFVSVYGAMDVQAQSMDSDGFTLKVVATDGGLPTGGAVVKYLAFTSTEVTASDLSILTVPTSDGNRTKSGLSFQPKALILGMTETQATDESSITNSYFSIGFCTSSSQHGTVGIGDSETPDDKSFSDAAALRGFRYFNVLQHKLVLSGAFASDGYTLAATSTNAEARPFMVIAINSPNVYAGRSALATSITTVSITGAGFTPSIGIFACTPGVTADATNTANAHIAIGATDGTNQVGTAQFSFDTAGSTSDVFASQYTDAVIKGIARSGADTFAVDSVLSFSAWTSDGATLSQSDAAPSAGKFAYLLIGASVPYVPPVLPYIYTVFKSAV